MRWFSVKVYTCDVEGQSSFPIVPEAFHGLFHKIIQMVIKDKYFEYNNKYRGFDY